jgi:hypothetical protein
MSRPTDKKETAMNYLLLLYGDEKAGANMSAV